MPSVTRSGTNENPVLNFTLVPGQKGDTGNPGAKGETGNGILSIEVVAETSSNKTLRINMTDGTYYDVTLENGEVTQAQLDEVISLNERILNNTPKGSTNTNPAYINDSADLPLNKFVLKGKTEQDSTTGINKLDKLTNSPKSSGVTYSSDLLSVTVDYNNSSDEYFMICPIESPTTKDYTLVFEASGVKSGESPRYTVYSNSPLSSMLANGRNYINIPKGTSINNSRLVLDDVQKTQYPNTSTVTFSKFMLLEGEYTEETMPPYEEYTGGIPSPSPTYPQEIRNVEGKNKFNKNKTPDKVDNATATALDTGIKVTSSSGGTYHWAGYIIGKVSELNGKTIRIASNIIKSVDDGLIRIVSCDATLANRTTLVSSGSSTGQTNVNYTVTNVSTDLYIAIMFNANQGTSGTSYTDYTNLIVTINNEDMSYVPYNSIQIKKCNNNLLDTSTCVGGGLNVTGGYDNSGYSSFAINGNKITVTITSTGRGIVSDYIECKPNTNYKVSYKTEETGSTIYIYYCFYDKNKNGLVRNTSGLAPENSKYMRVNVAVYTLTTINFYDIQLEEGEIQTDFVSHAEKTYNFPLAEGQKLMQDGKIEDKVVNEWGEVVFDGTENWTYSPTYHVVISPQIKAGKSSSTTINGKCNYCIISNSDNINYANTGHTFLQFKNLTSFWGLQEESVEAWKTLLATMKAQCKPLTIQYPLATPDETEFTPEQQAVIDEIIRDGTYKEVTHYTAEASINPNMEIGYYKDLETLFNNL